MNVMQTFKLFTLFTFTLFLTACCTPQPRFKLFEHFSQDPVDEAQLSEVIEWAKTKGYLAKLDIGEENAEQLFRSMLVNHNLPEELRNNDKLRNELIQVAKDKAGESSPLTPDEARDTAELIKSGEIFADIFYTFNTLFSLVVKPERFTNLDDSIKDHIGAAIHLPGSLIADLKPSSVTARVSSQIKRVKNGQQPEDPAILNNTLKSVFSAPEVGNSVEVINALLAPENESIRIAVLIYARLNGINLDQQDIDEVRNTVLDKDNPKLGALLHYLLTPENAARLAGAG